LAICHDLFLKTLRPTFPQNLFQLGSFVLDFSAAVFTLDEIFNHSALDWPADTKRSGGEVFMEFGYNGEYVAHAVRFKFGIRRRSITMEDFR